MARTQARRETAPIRIVAQPLYSLMLPIPIICFVGALLTDLAYLNSDGNLLWLKFSSWLIAAGLLFGGVAGLVALIDSVRGRTGYFAVALLAAAWVVELFNAFIHSRDGWTAVAGTGLILSILGVVLILVSAWMWQSLRHGREYAR